MLWMLDRNASEIVASCGNCRPEALGNRGDRSLPTALPDSVTRIDQRPLGLVQRQRDAFNIVIRRIAGAQPAAMPPSMISVVIGSGPSKLS